MLCPACNTSNEAPFGKCLSCGAPLGPLAVGVGFVVASRYELMESLGMGGMGAVFRAHDRMLEKSVAIKILREDLADSLDMLRRFRSEITIAQKVRHQNVCVIHHYGEDSGLRYILMELVTGHDLRQILRQGQLTAEEAFDISIQIAEGLEAIHDAQIIHRDLKSSNVMLDQQGRVRLMDFGIAKDHGNQGALATLVTNGTMGIIGTPDYMSPEQARGGRIDFRSDLYSLGVLIFEIFTGRVPFHGATLFSTLMKHIQEKPPLDGPEAARIPRSLIPVLAKALEKDPAARQQTVVELTRELNEAREIHAATEAGLPVAAGPNPADAPTDPSSLRFPGAPPRPTGRPAAAEPAPQPLVQWGVEFDSRTPTPPPTISGGSWTEAPPSRALPPPPAPPPPPPAPNREATAREATSRRPPVRTPPVTVHPGSGSGAVRRPQPVAAVAAMVVAAGLAAGLFAFLLYKLFNPGTPPTTLATQLTPTVPVSAPPTVPTTTRSVPPPSLTTPPPPPTTVPPPPTTVPAPPTTIPAPPTTIPAPPTTIPAPPTPGTLSLRVSPWAQVELDGRAVGTTPLKPLSLPPGSHTLRFTHPDFGTVQREVRVAAGQAVSVDLDLKDEVGLVQVLVTPWAEVSVDGRALGTTPLKPVALSPGVHRLRFSHPKFPAVERSVQVRRGETIKVEVDFAGQP